MPLNSYEQLRPEPAPYGRADKAHAGTVTDDSATQNRTSSSTSQGVQRGAAISVRDLAQAYIDFVPGPGQQASAKLSALNEEGFREYRFAARWLLGERDLNNALPVERLWAGVNNCSGQMMLPPLACVFPGDPKQAYRRAFELDFVDSPMARDMAAALVAGLSKALVDPEVDVRKRWQNMIDAMRQTDPYRQAAVPFAGRQLDRWLDRANSFVDRAQGSPKRMYAILESEGKPEFWWDAHFTLLVPLCMIRFCDFDPLAAMHLTLDFGHDTDSYAQVLGCMTGAVHGYQVFPESMRQAVQARLRVDYGESVDVWIDDLQAASNWR